MRENKDLIDRWIEAERKQVGGSGSWELSFLIRKLGREMELHRYLIGLSFLGFLFLDIICAIYAYKHP